MHEKAEKVHYLKNRKYFLHVTKISCSTVKQFR